MIVGDVFLTKIWTTLLSSSRRCSAAVVPI